MRRILFTVPILITLAACGETPLEQVIFGAGVGLGTAAVLDGNLAAGAAIGAAGNLLYCQTNPNRC